MHSRAIFSFCTRDPPFVLALHSPPSRPSWQEQNNDVRIPAHPNQLPPNWNAKLHKDNGEGKGRRSRPISISPSLGRGPQHFVCGSPAVVPVLRAALQTQKGEARGTHNSRPSWQSLPTGDPFENRAPSHPGYFFLVFDLFPVMPRFLLAVGLLVYSSLLQLPPALSFFFLHFFFSPAWWSPCSS